MSDHYNLPCECGNKLTVEMTQAGQDLNCPACGATVEVPSFSQLRRLESVEVPKPSANVTAKNTEARRGQGQAMMFAFGLILLFGGLIAGAVFWILATKVYAEPPHISETDMEGLTKFVEDASPAFLDTAWREKMITDEPDADDFEPHNYYTHKVLYENYRLFAIISGCVAGAGLLLLAVSFLIPKPAPRRMRQK